MSEAVSVFDQVRAWGFQALPQHLISRLTFRLTRLRSPLVPLAIRGFIRLFQVDMSEALGPEPGSYPSFNAFFTRALRPQARPVVPEKDAIACPVDGTLSQLGMIQGERILQAKGRDYSAFELLGGHPHTAEPFRGGRFCTLYLSPRDYHRVHMPLSATLREMVYVPGRLFSVAPYATRTIPRLFARNERVACLFDTGAGPMAVVMVGAINVAAIETVWAGLVTPPPGPRIQVFDYRERARPIRLEKGQEMGRFNMGSTVIVLFPKGAMEWDPGLEAGARVRIGKRLGRLI
jgi:phosphatidylserine decarboxylase